MAKIALLGFGVVGGGVAEILLQNSELVKKSAGEDVEIKYILDKRDFFGTDWQDKVVKDIDIILNDSEVSVVCEMLGGVSPAYEFTLAAIRSGKSVVTSNKAVVAEKGPELFREAEKAGVHYLYEASVGGGIPIIHAMNSSLSSCEIYGINGILNGTTNYILTRMSEGEDYKSALSRAQELGYAEKDPTADVSGIDACRKICILTATAHGVLCDCERVYCRGIDDITDEEKALAEALGGVIKLVAAFKLHSQGYALTVQPTVAMRTSPLSSVSDVYNAVEVDASFLGRVMFYGRGAGRAPTASAVVSDIVDIVAGVAPENPVWKEEEALDYALYVKDSYSVSADLSRDKVRELFGEKADVYSCSSDGSKCYFTVGDVTRAELEDKLSGIKCHAVMRAVN